MKPNSRKTEKKICQRTEEGISFLMTCKGICLRHKAINWQLEDAIFRVKSVAKHAFSSCGKDFLSMHVDTDFVQDQGIESTS
jgi:hypothetical protein